MHHALPTDRAVTRKGVTLVSKSSCCSTNPDIEYNNHLFLSSKIATVIWSFFSDLLQVKEVGLTIHHKLSTWWQAAKGKKLKA